MPDGKVDKVVSPDNKATGYWHAPVYGVDVNVNFSPQWNALQDWNSATLGVGVTYWNMGHDKLGHAIAPYGYLNIPLVKIPGFELGLRPGLGFAFMTKTYRNTVEDGDLFVS